MFTAAILLAWASSGTVPFRDAILGAAAPSDFATDFVPAARLWRGTSARVDVVTGNAEAALLGAPRYADIGVPFGAHPPPAVLLIAALVPFGFRAAALGWLVLSLGCLGVVTWVAADHLAPREPRRVVIGLALFGALALWPPVLHNIEKGQWSLIVAGLLAGAWRATTRGHHGLAGALVGIAGSFKVMPFLVLPALFCNGRWRRVAAGAGGALALTIAASVVVVGWRAWPEFVRSAPINTAGWQTGPANTLSLWGALSRLLVGGAFARPLSGGANAASIARVSWVLVAAGLVSVALRLTLRPTSPVPVDGSRPSVARSPGSHVDAGQQASVFAAWTVLAVVLGPLSWSHAATELALPVALLARSLRDPEGGSRSAPRLVGVLGLAVMGLTIPRLTLFAWAGQLPVTPGRGLALGVHLVAALAIFIVAVLVARRAERDWRSWHPPPSSVPDGKS